MGWIGFVAKNPDVTLWHELFALIAPVQYVLKQVSCRYETIPNALKYYKMDRNISLGSNGVDWVRLWQKNPDVTSWHELL